MGILIEEIEAGIAVVDELEAADRRMDVELQAIHDGVAEESGVIAERGAVDEEPAAKAEQLKDARLDAGVELDVQRETRRGAAQPEEGVGLADELATAGERPTALERNAEPGGEPGNEVRLRRGARGRSHGIEERGHVGDLRGERAAQRIEDREETVEEVGAGRVCAIGCRQVTQG